MLSLKKIKNYTSENFKFILIVILIIFIVLWLSVDLFKNIFKERNTYGKSQLEIIQLFYTGINKLDFELMSDCVIKNAGRKKINEIITMQTLTKVGGNNLITADEWNIKGRPLVDVNDMIYGITNIHYSKKNNNTYTVEYEKWVRVYDETVEKNNKVILEGYKIIEEVHLEKRKKKYLFKKTTKEFWVIDKIKMLESYPKKINL